MTWNIKISVLPRPGGWQLMEKLGIHLWTQLLAWLDYAMKPKKLKFPVGDNLDSYSSVVALRLSEYLWTMVAVSSVDRRLSRLWCKVKMTWMTVWWISKNTWNTTTCDTLLWSLCWSCWNHILMLVAWLWINNHFHVLLLRNLGRNKQIIVRLYHNIVLQKTRITQLIKLELVGLVINRDSRKVWQKKQDRHL